MRQESPSLVVDGVMGTCDDAILTADVVRSSAPVPTTRLIQLELGQLWKLNLQSKKSSNADFKWKSINQLKPLVQPKTNVTSPDR